MIGTFIVNNFGYVFVIGLILGNAVCEARTKADPVKRIAITIDDAPSPPTKMFTGQQRALSIIEKLKQVDAPAVGIFAIGKHAVDFGSDQLMSYGLAGHAICNHTYSHNSLKYCSVENYIKDIQKAEHQLKDIPGYTRLFRYPYLDEGYPAQSKKMQTALNDMGYTHANITINNCDYYMCHLLQRGLQSGKRLDVDKLRSVYLKVMLECVEYFEDWFVLQGKTNMNHVLLMHSNDLTALYIGDLVAELRNRGWTVISIHEAYKPVPEDFNNATTITTKALPTNPARARNSPKGMSPRYLAELFQQEKVFLDAKPNETYTASK